VELWCAAVCIELSNTRYDDDAKDDDAKDAAAAADDDHHHDGCVRVYRVMMMKLVTNIYDNIIRS